MNLIHLGRIKKQDCSDTCKIEVREIHSESKISSFSCFFFSRVIFMVITVMKVVMHVSVFVLFPERSVVKKYET